MARVPLRPRSGAADAVAGSVTSLELFFDLVFVFAITQLTATLEAHHGWGAVGRTVLLLSLMFWMYGGYAWLTNAAPPITPLRQGFYLLGMGANFVMALAVPRAFGTDRLIFALAYLLVLAVHSAMYLTQSNRVTPGMVLQLVLWNGLCGLLVVVGALLGEGRLVVCWVAAFIVATVLPRLFDHTRLRARSGAAFVLQPQHFVERHGLMLLIVLGESVLAVGTGVGRGATSIGPAQVGFAAVSLTLAATLFWAYFGTHEDDAAERALTDCPVERQEMLALKSYGLALALMLFGVVLTASGLEQALTHPLDAQPLESALHLAGGVALFWAGLGVFRLSLGQPNGWLRLAGSLMVVAAWLGQATSGFVELLALLAASLLLIVASRGRAATPTTA